MEQQVTINEFVVKFIDEMRRTGYVEEGIYREHYRIVRRFARYYELSNTLYYSIETTTEYLNLMKERENRGEIGSGMLKRIRIMAQKRMNILLPATCLFVAQNVELFIVSALKTSD